MSSDVYRRIETATNARYSARWAEFGESIETLGWGSIEQQRFRFDRVLEAVELNDRSVLDIGCGFGDLHTHVRARGISVRGYTGVDINEDLLGVARHRHPDAGFLRASPMELTPADVSADVGIMLGLLNFRQQDLANMDYLRGMVGRAFDLCREALVFDALSEVRTPDYPEEAFVYYYDPAEVLRFALGQTPHVTLRHDFRAIPQREMLVVLRRQPCA